MFAGEYCNRNVSIIGRSDTLVKAAKLMREHHVGDLLVIEPHNGERVPVGILTDRDIVIEVIAEDTDIHLLYVEDVMSYKLITAHENDDLMSTIKRMRINGIRRIPVISQAGGLVGILSTDDILDVITEQLMDIDQIIVNEQNREKEVRSTISRH
jgi:CBS domain-containing protein